MTTDSARPLYLRSLDPDPSNPFAGDLFGRRDLANRLTEHLKRLQEGAVIAIDAPWGEGKSWFGRNWYADLQALGYRAAYIDAFQRDYVEDPFVMINGELRALLQQDAEESSRRLFARAGVRVAKALVPAATKMLLNVVGHHLLGTQNLSDTATEVLETVQEKAANAAERQVETLLSQYEEEKQGVDEFRSALRKFAASAPNKPVVIFLDELDRCRPDFALRTIERIKHFFDVPGLVFVLLTNRVQLEACLRGLYGEQLDAHTYLQKFIQFSLVLPKIVATEGTGESDNKTFCLEVLLRYGFGDASGLGGSGGFHELMSGLSNVFGMSLRDIERSVILYSLGQPIDKRDHLLAWPIALKIKRRELFEKVLAGHKRAHEDASKLCKEILSAHPGLTSLGHLSELHELAIHGERHRLSTSTAGMVSAKHFVLGSASDFLPRLFKKVDLSLTR